jgi:SSS family solute:Na+ symporter
MRLTAVLSSRSQDVVRRNMSLLPAWTFLLGLMALMGYMAIAAGLNVTDPNETVPALFVDQFPSWFLGIAFAAIAIGALVPAAVMSIAAATCSRATSGRSSSTRTALSGRRRGSRRSCR